jgi:hypothetical protein
VLNGAEAGVPGVNPLLVGDPTAFVKCRSGDCGDDVGCFMSLLADA